MRVLIRYRVRPEHVRATLDDLQEVYAELDVVRPGWLSHSTYQLDTGVDFVSLVSLDNPARLAELPAFRAYRSRLEERCDDPPVTTQLREVGDFAPA